MSKIKAEDKPILDEAWEKLLRIAGIREHAFNWSLSSLIDQGADVTPTFGTVDSDFLRINVNSSLPSGASGVAVLGLDLNKRLQINIHNNGYKSLAMTSMGIANPLDHGADPTGVEDSAQAIQEALAASAHVHLPPGRYAIDTPINLQGLIGRRISGNGDQTQIIVRCAGKIGFDCQGADRLVFKDLRIIGDSTSVPAVGVFCGRPITNASSGTHYFENVWIVGSFSKAAYIGNSSECSTYIGGQIRNDYSGGAIACIASSNVMNVVSDFATVPANPSGGNTVHHFVGTYFAYTPNDRLGDGLWLDGIRSIDFLGCFFQGAGSKGIKVTTGLSTFNIVGGENEWSGDHGIWINAGVVVDNANIEGFHSDRPIYAGAGGGFRNSKIHANFNYEVGGPGPQGCMDVDILEFSEVYTHGHALTVRTTAQEVSILDGTSAGVAGSGLSLPASATGIRYGESYTKPDGHTYNRTKIAATNNFDRLKTHALQADILQTTVQTTSASAQSGVYAPDLNSGSVVFVTLDQNLTVNLPTGAKSTGDNTYEEGSELTFIFRQDLTGGRTVTFASAPYTYVVGSWKVDPTASSYSTISFRLDPNSASWIQTGGYPFGDLSAVGAIVSRGATPWATSALGAGELILNNGAADGGGIHFYYDNNTNIGIDAGQSVGLRFVKNLDEAGGTILATLAPSGNFATANSGNITAAGQFKAQNGSSAAPGYAFSNYSNLGMYAVDSLSIGFASASALKWIIDGTNFSGSLVPAADNAIDLGATTKRLAALHTNKIDLAGNSLLTNAGSPNGTVTAAKGSICINTSGSSGTLLYVNTDGATAWTAFA